MPEYLYECEVCGERLSERARISDPPRRVCPVGREGALCGGDLHRVPGRVTTHLKGAGWYRDGYS